jgi:uncharacterized damage-inducible protein DinB
MITEIQDYVTELSIIRGQILEAVQGLGDEAGNWHPLSKDTNSIYAVLSHVIGAQNNWIRKIIAGQEIQRDREAELRSSGPLSDIIERFKNESREIEVILGSLSQPQLSETRKVPAHPQGNATVRWCILHILSHNATHLGHIQLTRQLWDQR